jgi:hypothetical protein
MQRNPVADYRVAYLARGIMSAQGGWGDDVVIDLWREECVGVLSGGDLVQKRGALGCEK